MQAQPQSERLKFELKPALPWAAILSFIILTLLFMLAGAGKLLNLAYPAYAVMVGVLLYVRAPLLFNGFVWWMWFLSPFVRRVSDWRGSFTEPSPILLAPYLVTLIALITLWKYLFRPKQYQNNLPFMFSFFAIIYGGMIGMVFKSPVTVAIGVLDWLAPVIWSFHLFAHWRNYPNLRQNLSRIFIWGILVMGVYGVIQYLVAPEWDLLWRKNADFTSSGDVNSTEIRVWSTLDSPRPFAAAMMSCLIFLFNYEGALFFPASIFGYLSFLLSLARAPWAGWLVGLLTLFSTSRAKFQMRLVLTIGIMVMSILPFAMMAAFSGDIGERLATFGDLESDNSANERQYWFSVYINDALVSWLGQGIGGKIYDWGIFTLLFFLGWFGTLFYIGGLVLLIARLYSGDAARFDPFVGVARAVVLANFVMFSLGNPTLGIQGMMIWGLLGIGLAGQRYYQEQRRHFLNSVNSVHSIN